MAFDLERLQALAALAWPDARVVGASPLKGGISATMAVIELADGRMAVARRPGDWVTEEDPDGGQTEFQTLARLHALGLPVPAALAIEPTGGPDRIYLMEHIDGAPDLSPADPADHVRQAAETLAMIHRVDWMASGLDALRRLRNPWRPRGETVNEAMGEGRARAALEATGPLDDPNPTVLRHGDFWPGNLLWRDGRLVAVVDWEAACLAGPLGDLAVSRLDTLWVLGWERMEEFTEAYLRANPVDVSQLPHFDLRAAVRLASDVEKIASAYPDLGRPDITSTTLTQDCARFVEAALAQV
jgi:aminoglycoside phosphotransferase (APT) family kinase protein